MHEPQVAKYIAPLKDKDDVVRFYGTQALERIGGDRAIEVLRHYRQETK